MSYRYSYAFIKNINVSLYERFDEFIRIFLPTKDSSYLFISNTSLLFELAFKQFLYSKNMMYNFFMWDDPTLYEMLSDDCLVYLKQYFNLDFNIIHQYRIDSNSSRHKLFPTISVSNKKDIMKKIFQVYVLLNNHLTSNKVDYPSDEYINMLCSNQQNLINDINENINKLNVITNKISESENYSKELLSEIKRLEEKIQIVKNEYQIESMNLNSNLKSIGFNKLKEEDFIRAEFLFENAIKQNILDYDSYVGYFLSINKSKDLINLLSKPILDITLLDIYIQATEILTGKQKETIVEIGVKVSLQYKYIIAMNYFNDKSFKSALDMFSKIPNYQDSLSMIDECNKGLIYCEGLDFFKNSNYEKSLECFERVCDFLDSRYYIDLNKTNISKQKYKEEILGKKRMLLKADKFFKNLMFDDAIEIYENLQCIEELKKIKEFKELYQLFIKYVNFEVGGEKLLDYNKDNELFIEVSRYFPDCFNIRNTEIFNIFAKQYFEKTYIDIIKEINIIEEKINMYERNIVVSALLFAAFNKPFLDLENQIVNFIDQFPIESDYYKIMIYEYSKCNYKINILERI